MVEKLRRRSRNDHSRIIGTSNVKRQEQGIGALRREVAARDEAIETLQTKISAMQNDHSRELTAMQARHPADKRKLRLNIDKRPFAVWGKEQFEKLRRVFRHPTRRQHSHKGAETLSFPL